MAAAAFAASVAVPAAFPHLEGFTSDDSTVRVPHIAAITSALSVLAAAAFMFRQQKSQQQPAQAAGLTLAAAAPSVGPPHPQKRDSTDPTMDSMDWTATSAENPAN